MTTVINIFVYLSFKIYLTESLSNVISSTLDGIWKKNILTQWTSQSSVSLLSLHCHGSEASWLGSLCVTCPWVLHAQAWISVPLSTSGYSQPSPSPVGLPGLEVLPLLLIIHLSAQLADVGLLCHLSCSPVYIYRYLHIYPSTCELLPVQLLALHIMPRLGPNIIGA